jgi:hypothetical protein
MFSRALSCVAIEARGLVLLDEVVDVRAHYGGRWKPKHALANVEELYRGVLSQEGCVLAVSLLAIGAVHDVYGDSFAEALLMPLQAKVRHPLRHVEVQRVVEQVLGVHRERVFGTRSQVAIFRTWPWRVLSCHSADGRKSCGNIRVSWYGPYRTA